MKITIITICYNAEEDIEDTVLSVIMQTYKNIEYIIIDGASTDKTLDILHKYSEEKMVAIHSEPDSGIYNAMNRGITRATGDYVIFMNAGDRFFDECVLDKVVKIIKNTRGSNWIFYGKVYRAHCKGRGQRIKDFSEVARSPLQGFLNREMPCHQGITAPIGSLKKFYFNEEYKFCADFDWLIRCYKNGYKLMNTDCMICRYDDTGLTSKRKNREKMRKESEKILKRNFPVMFRLKNMVENLYKRV